MKKLTRTNYRVDLLEEVLARWTDGRLAAGRVNESELAEELGISRTPLREALLMMEQRGMLRAETGRGFLVTPPHREEAESLYSLLATLEPMALRAALPGLRPRLPELRALLARLQDQQDTASLMAFGGAWSGALIDGCGNAHLVRLLTGLYAHAGRYEYATLKHGFPVAEAVGNLGRVVDAIEAGDADRAAAELADNWNHCLAALRRFLPALAELVPERRRFKR